MSILPKIRLIAAIVLIVATCLPLSECSRPSNENAPPPPATKSFVQRFFPQSNSDFEYAYAIGVMRFSSWQAGAFALTALAWPILAVLFDNKVARRRCGWIIYILELLLCYGTLYWLSLFTALGRALYGTYVVVAAIAFFGGATVFLFVLSIRNFLTRRRALKELNQSA